MKSSFCIISSRNNHQTHGRSFWFFNEDSLDFFIGLVLFLVSEIVPINFGLSGEDNQFVKLFFSSFSKCVFEFQANHCQTN